MTVLNSANGHLQLKGFFEDFGKTTRSALSDQLRVFFDELDVLVPLAKEAKTEQRQRVSDLLNHLPMWFAEMAEPLRAARSGAFLFNPWDVAGLRHDEVRNSRVLAWILDPRGSHGLGATALHGLLRWLNESGRPDECGRLPVEVTQRCMVRVESNPDGDACNRVDIEIHDHDEFYLIIEVKIRAKESDKQLKMYGDKCKIKARGKLPWRILFLTPRGVKSRSAKEHYQHVTSISWAEISRVLMTVIREKLLSGERTTKHQHAVDLSIAEFFNHAKTF